jgi:hypothetical protein
MREPTPLSLILSAKPFRERATAIESLSRWLSPHWRNHLYFALAAAQFGAGHYAAAHRLYSAVDGGPLREEADLMVDWIDYKFGRVARGWPRYPVARFNPPEHPAVAPGNGPVRVRNFNRPIELIAALGLRPWPPGTPSDLPILVWFNFHDSLGGEVLAALAVKAFQRRTGARLVLAVDDRHITTMIENFPGTEVVGKSSDLRSIVGRVGGYLLARDVLAHVVRTEADFGRVAEHTFFASPADMQTGVRSRPLLAVSWKTTNRRQGKFRNLPIEGLASLLASVDADFVSAQHGVTPAERAFLSKRLPDRIRFDLIDTSADVATLAGCLKACDGVLTVDNSVLHIAGAYGVPTLGLLALPAYWAWPVAGKDSRWYPSVSFLHQQVPGRWTDVLDEAKPILHAWRGGVFA